MFFYLPTKKKENEEERKEKNGRWHRMINIYSVSATKFSRLLFL